MQGIRVEPGHLLGPKVDGQRRWTREGICAEVLKAIEYDKTLLSELQGNIRNSTKKLSKGVQGVVKAALDLALDSNPSMANEYYIKFNPQRKVNVGAEGEASYNVLDDVGADMEFTGWNLASKLLQVNTLDGAVLMFVGGEGAITPLHADRTSASNVLMSLEKDIKKRYQKDLAEWICLYGGKHHTGRPVLDIVVEYFKGKGIDVDFSDKDKRPFITAEIFEELQERLDKDSESKMSYIRRIIQRHGDMVLVEAGWLHQVRTLGACVKIAFDHYHVSQLANYVRVWSDIISPYMGNGVDDYMNIQRFIMRPFELGLFL